MTASKGLRLVRGRAQGFRDQYCEARVPLPPLGLICERFALRLPCQLIGSPSPPQASHTRAPRSTHASTALTNTERRQQGAAGVANGDEQWTPSALKADFVNAEQVAAIGQEETSGALLIERAPDPETDDAVPIAGCSTAMTSRAHLVRNAGPGTAAEAMAAAIAGHPRRSIDRCTPVILV